MNLITSLHQIDLHFRASKSAADDSWPSSDEEDELDITQKVFMMNPLFAQPSVDSF